MIANIFRWFQGRTPREQVLLAVMLALLALVIGWLGVVKPLANARIEAADRLALANSDLGDITAQTRLIRAAEARVRTASAAPLIDTVRARAAEVGFSGENITGDGEGRVTMRVPAVKPAVLLSWIADIETRDGIQVDRLATTRNADATVAAELGFERIAP